MPRRARPRSSSCVPRANSRTVRAMNARSRIAASAAASAATFTGYGDCALRMIGGELAMHENAAEAQAREAGRFRKCARDDQIPVAADPRNHRDARKFEIGFVDHDHRLLRRVQNSPQLAQRKQIAGRAVRIRQEKDARRRFAAPPAPRCHGKLHLGVVARRRRSARLRARNKSDTSRRSARRAAPRRPARRMCSRSGCSASSVPFVSSNSSGRTPKCFARPCGARFPARDTPKSSPRSASRARGARRASSRSDSR